MYIFNHTTILCQITLAFQTLASIQPISSSGNIWQGMMVLCSGRCINPVRVHKSDPLIS